MAGFIIAALAVGVFGYLFGRRSGSSDDTTAPTPVVAPEPGCGFLGEGQSDPGPHLTSLSDGASGTVHVNSQSIRHDGTQSGTQRIMSRRGSSIWVIRNQTANLTITWTLHPPLRDAFCNPPSQAGHQLAANGGEYRLRMKSGDNGALQFLQDPNPNNLPFRGKFKLLNVTNNNGGDGEDMYLEC